MLSCWLLVFGWWQDVWTVWGTVPDNNCPCETITVLADIFGTLSIAAWPWETACCITVTVGVPEVFIWLEDTIGIESWWPGSCCWKNCGWWSTCWEVDIATDDCVVAVAWFWINVPWGMLVPVNEYGIEAGAWVLKVEDGTTEHLAASLLTGALPCITVTAAFWCNCARPVWSCIFVVIFWVGILCWNV